MAKALAYLTFPITKRTSQADGSVIVEGPVTDDSLDLDGQIVDAAYAAKSLQEWFDEYANVRQQHSPILAPAGKGISLTFKNGVPWLKAKIIEPTAIKLVLAKIYQAFSIGIADGMIDTSPAARKRAPNGILYPTLTNEVSITDYPANVGMGKFSFAKRKNGSLYLTERITEIDKSLRNLEGDSLVTALKSLHTGATAKVGAIVYTAKSPKKAAKLIGTQFNPHEYEAQGNVIVMKRDFDAGVGNGGTDRDKIPAKDFAGPNRTYPITTPGDVQDAASLIGKADNPDAVKAKIIAIANRKGPEFVAKLPKKWRNEMGKSQKSKKAAGTEDGKPFPGAAEPFKSDKDDTDDKSMHDMDDDADTKKKSKKGKIPEADQKVTDDLKKVDDAVGDAKDDQDDDNQHHLDDDADDQDDDSGDKSMKSEKGSKKKLAKAARRMAKEAKKQRDAKAAETMAAMKRAHDVLCPLYKKSVTKSLGAVTDAIVPEFFLERLNAVPEEAFETYAARKSAYLAATDIATLKVPQLNELRRVAHKAFTDAYPDVKVASPDLSDPSSFQRGFLPSANSTVATSMSKPGNFVDAKPLAPDQFTRGPLTTNEARPSLVGGTPAASMKGRQFYTNAAKDANADAMATLHDHIADNYPSICPGMGDESGDRLGTPAEMYSHASPTTLVDGKAASSLASVSSADLMSATKRATEEALQPFIKKAAKREKRQAKEIKRLKKSLAEPNWSKSARRQTQFAPTHAADVTDITKTMRERNASAKRIAERIHDSHSVSSYDDLKELQELVPATQFANLMVDDD